MRLAAMAWSIVRSPVQSGGALNPGTSAIGALTIANTLTLADGSTTSIKIDKASNTDNVVAVNSVNYGGKLVVSNLAGILEIGNSFKLFSAGSHSGTFAQVAISGASGTFDSASGMLTITGLTADYPTNISYSFTSGQLSMTWPETHKGWYTQSNSVTSRTARCGSIFQVPTQEQP